MHRVTITDDNSKFYIVKHLVIVECCGIRKTLSIPTLNSLFYLVKNLVSRESSGIQRLLRMLSLNSRNTCVYQETHLSIKKHMCLSRNTTQCVNIKYEIFHSCVTVPSRFKKTPQNLVLKAIK